MKRPNPWRQTVLLTSVHFADPSQRVAKLLEAVPPYEELLESNPSDPERLRNVALVHKYLAGNLIITDLDRSLPHLQRAMAVDEARLANSPGDPSTKLDLSFDYSQFAAYYSAKKDLLKAREYSRKTVDIRRQLANADPMDMWKQDRLAWALSETGSLQLHTHDYGGALESLNEARTVIERMGGKADSDTYALIMYRIGQAQRNLRREPLACSAFIKARKIYYKTQGGSPPGGQDAPVLYSLERALATCGKH